jgi:hypothetical protein
VIRETPSVGCNGISCETRATYGSYQHPNGSINVSQTNNFVLFNQGSNNMNHVTE